MRPFAKHVPHLVIGGGIAGLTIALALRDQCADFLLLESSPRLGGKIETVKAGNNCLETGPTSLAAPTPATFALIERLLLDKSLVTPSPRSKNRFIIKKGRMRRLPSSPKDFFTTGALSFGGKLRFMSEIFAPKPSLFLEESVWEFFERHFGKETAKYIADPFVSGVYAGDATRLAIKTALPAIDQAEAASPSLIRYLFQKRGKKSAAPAFYEIRGGLESIFHHASQILDNNRIHLNESVQNIIPEGHGARVITDKEEYIASKVYVTAPAYAAGNILEKNYPDLTRLLNRVDYAPVVVAHLKISSKEKFPFNGFGVLIPSSEKRKILGALWNSSTFPELFSDSHYLTVYAGGTRDRNFIRQEDDRIQKIVLDEAENLFGLKQGAEIVHLKRHPQAIPQCNLGYGSILDGIKEQTKKIPFLKLAGNYLGGVSITKTISHALATVPYV